MVLGSGRVSEKKKVRYRGTVPAKSEIDTLRYLRSPRGEFCPGNRNGQTLALPRHAASGVPGAQGLHDL